MTKKQAQMILDTQDYQPWMQVEDAKRKLGYDIEKEKRDAERERQQYRWKHGLIPQNHV